MRKELMLDFKVDFYENKNIIIKKGGKIKK